MLARASSRCKIFESQTNRRFCEEKRIVSFDEQQTTTTKYNNTPSLFSLSLTHRKQEVIQDAVDCAKIVRETFFFVFSFSARTWKVTFCFVWVVKIFDFFNDRRRFVLLSSSSINTTSKHALTFSVFCNILTTTTTTTTGVREIRNRKRHSRVHQEGVR